MELKKLKSIYQVARKVKIHEVSFETKSTKLRMILDPSKQHEEPPDTSAMDMDSSATDNGTAKNSTLEKLDPDLNEGGIVDKFDILSPQIGFFSRYNPKTKKQYVKLRDVIEKGVVVATIRSMHLTYEVVADRTGKITEFLVEEGQPVEYHQPLLRLVPSDERSHG